MAHNASTSVVTEQSPKRIDSDEIMDSHLTGEGAPIEMPAVQRQLLYGRKDSDRTIPMKLLVVGMPGTSSTALCDALRQLGIEKIYDTRQFLEPKSTAELGHLHQMQLGDTRKRRNTYFTAADFDPMLKDYEAVIDWPGAAYATDLMIAFRDAKVILTTLPPAGERVWQRKLEKTFYALHNSTFTKILIRTNIGNFRLMYKLLTTISNSFFDGSIAQHALMSYKIHDARIKGTLNLQNKDENRDLLVYDPANDGWGPLCKFLDVPIPEGMPFPTSCIRSSLLARSSSTKDISYQPFRDLEPWRLFIRYINHSSILSYSLAVPCAFFIGPHLRTEYYVGAGASCFLLALTDIMRKKRVSQSLKLEIPFTLGILSVCLLRMWVTGLYGATFRQMCVDGVGFSSSLPMFQIGIQLGLDWVAR